MTSTYTVLLWALLLGKPIAHYITDRLKLPCLHRHITPVSAPWPTIRPIGECNGCHRLVMR